MLILARKVGQRIVIGDDIEITVVEVRGEQVRLGVTAPRAVAVNRKELLEQIAASNLEAANSSASMAQVTSALRNDKL